MSKIKLGPILFALGLVILVVSLAADSFGIGAVGGIGWKQWLGATVGAVLEIAGLWLVQKK